MTHNLIHSVSYF